MSIIYGTKYFLLDRIISNQQQRKDTAPYCS